MSYNTKLFINNEFVDAESGIEFPTYNPATEEVLANVQEAGKADVDKAVAAAKKAFEIGSEWRSMDASARGQMIHKFAQLLRRDAEKIARLESLNNGKSYSEALFDMDCSISCIEYYSGWTDKIFGKTIPVDGNFFCFTKHEPIGVCAQIIPWNYPVMMLAWKFGPALACGNTIVLKPAEQTPLTALLVAELIVEAGFPAGVVNIINGRGFTTGQLLSEHMEVSKIAFTGSVVVGRKIQEASAKSNLKRVTLELGGKSPFIITDVDDELVRRAAQDTAGSIFANQGQSCCASSRVFVHENVYDKFVAELVSIANAKVVGDPFNEETTNGAIVSKVQFERILGYIQSGIEEGATVAAGGVKCADKGYFLRPTVFTNVTDSMKIAKEEIFGPVVCVFKWTTIDEVIKRANDTSYGLGSGVYSRDMNVIMKISSELQAGSVWVNSYEIVTNQAPFGGFKQSGFGRELGEYGLHEYTEVKNVTMRLN